MTTGSNVRRLFTTGRGERRSAGERAAVAAQSAPQEEPPAALRPGESVERTAPDYGVYLDPDMDGGRSRIIIMLSEDKTIIEPVLRIQLSEAQYVSILVQQAERAAQEMVTTQATQEQQIAHLLAEIDFLREQVRKGAQPPSAGVIPAPFPDMPVNA